MEGLQGETAGFLGASLKGLGAMLLLNALALGAARRFQRYLWPTSNPIDYILAVFLLFTAVVVAWLTALGALGLLDLPEVIFVFLTFYLAIFLLGRIQDQGVDEVSWREEWSGYSWTASALKAAKPAVRIAAIALAPFVVAHVLWALITPPPPGGDGFIYHLFFPAMWRQTGGIDYVGLPFGTQATTYYPCNMELFYLWIIGPFRSDFLANAVQLFFLAACVLLLHRMARRMGLGSPAAGAVAFAVALMPAMVQQSAVARVDIAFACFFLYALYFLQRYINSQKNGYVLLGGAATGLFLGTKIIGLLFAPLIVLPFLLAIATLEKKLSAALGKMARYLIPAVLGCGFWYGRNWIATGNPVYPLNVALFGKTIFQGLYGSDAMQVFHTANPAEWAKIFDLFLGRGETAALVLCYAAGWIALLRKRRPPMLSVYLGFAPLIYAALFWFVNPHNNLTNGRFLFPAFFLVALHAGHAFNLPGRPGQIARILAVLGAIAANFQHPNLFQEAREIALAAAGLSPGRFQGAALACWLALASMAAIAGAVLARKESGWEGKARALPLLSLVLVSVTLVVVHHYYLGAKMRFYVHSQQEIARMAEERLDIGDAWFLFDKYVPGPATVAFAGTDRPYGLIGKGMDHRLVYVNVDQRPGWQFHDYHRFVMETGGMLERSERPQYHRRFGKLEYWLSNMKDSGATWLFISTLDPVERQFMEAGPHGFPKEETWARSRPDIFRLKYESENTRIYQVQFPSNNYLQ